MVRLTLTFDNGPTPGVTDYVLDELALRAVRATFFLIGQQLRDPEARRLAERARADGHRIGNHTMTHSVLFGLSRDPAAPEAEITQAQELLDGLADEDRLFRPWGDGGLGPHLFSPAAIDVLTHGRYTCVLWNSVPRDWEDPVGWVERAVNDVRARDWTVMVLHDIAGGAMERLPLFLDAVIAAGVELVQDFPDDCVPIRRGIISGTLDHLTTT